MKKHIDWKRVGWTVGIPIIIWFTIHGLYLIGKISNSFIMPEYFLYPCMAYWINGLAHITVFFLLPLFIIILIIFIVVNAKNIFKGVVTICQSIKNFFYHNGSENKK